MKARGVAASAGNGCPNPCSSLRCPPHVVAARPARAATMRPLIEELRTKQANLRRVVLRKTQSAKGADLPDVLAAGTWTCPAFV